MVLLLLLLLLWLLAVPKDAMLVIPPLELLLLVVVLVGGVIVAALLLLLFDIGDRPCEAEDAGPGGAGGMTEGADWPATADGGAGGRKGGLGQDGAPRLARRDIGSSEAPERAPAAELFRKELGG